MRLSLQGVLHILTHFVSRLAYRSGVSTAVTSPISNGLLGGLGTYISLAAEHGLENGAVLHDVTAVHVAVLHQGGPSVSTQIAALRRLLLGPYTGERGASFEAVAKVRLRCFPESPPHLTRIRTGKVASGCQREKRRHHCQSFEAQARSRGDLWYADQNDPRRRR